MSRLGRLAGAIAVLGIIVGGGWWLVRGGVLAGAGPGSGTASSGQADGAGPSAAKTAPVTRRTLTVTEELDATLRYAGEYRVVGGLVGTLTWTVPEGTVVTAGKPLYETDGRNRASLMYGNRPAWRTLEAGASDGADVLQLERNLQRLGFTRRGDTIDRHWDARTTAAVKRWQKKARLVVDGKLDLGEIVFLPEAVRITKIDATLGSGVGPGGPLMSGTSNRRVVALDLDADEVDAVHVKAAVKIELPDGSSVDGHVASIGTVAETSTDQQGGSSTTLPVTITIDDAAAAAGLDQAPVTVTLVRETRENVLTVPVSALVALLEGGYAVEVVDGSSSSAGASPAPSSAASSGSSGQQRQATHLVRVEPGLFDHGTVQVTASGLKPGDLVVVP